MTVWPTMSFTHLDQMKHQTITTVWNGAVTTASVVVLLSLVTSVSSRIMSVEIILKMVAMLFFTSSKVDKRDHDFQ